MLIRCCKLRPRPSEDFLGSNHHHVTKAFLCAVGRASSCSISFTGLLPLLPLCHSDPEASAVFLLVRDGWEGTKIRVRYRTFVWEVCC